MGIKFVQIKDHALFQWEIIAKIIYQYFKIFFPRTTWAISTKPTKLGTKHPQVKGIQDCSNEGMKDQTFSRERGRGVGGGNTVTFF